MFSLLVVVIAIALVVLLVAATSYYGGDSYEHGKRQTNVSGMISQMDQIIGAAEIYSAENPTQPLASVNDLVPTYLTSIPLGWEVSPASQPDLANYATLPISGSDESGRLALCEAVNKSKGFTGPVPSCDALPTNFSGCCVGS